MQLGRRQNFNSRTFGVRYVLFESCSAAFGMPPLFYTYSQPAILTRRFLIVKCVSQLASKFQDVSIIVDGLDECGSSTSDVITSLTSLCSNAGSNIRSLFLSRDEYEIRELLSEAFFHVNIAAQSEDLKLYVAAQIDSRERLVGRGQLRIRSKDLKQHIITKLVDGAQGM